MTLNLCDYTVSPLRLANLLKDSSPKYDNCHINVVPTLFGLLSFEEHKLNEIPDRIHIYKGIFVRIICETARHFNDPCSTGTCFPAGGPQNLPFIRLSEVDSTTTPKEFIR